MDKRIKKDVFEGRVKSDYWRLYIRKFEGEMIIKALSYYINHGPDVDDPEVWRRLLNKVARTTAKIDPPLEAKQMML